VSIPLVFAYAVHLLATVLWTGSLLWQGWLMPSLLQNKPELRPNFERLMQQQTLIGLGCLAALAVTGMFQMASHPAYQGTLVLNSPWTIVLLVKHILFLFVAALQALLVWGIQPELRRLDWLSAHSPDPAPIQKRHHLQKLEQRLLHLNLLLAVLILIATATARVTG
jgi:putative copper export protein